MTARVFSGIQPTGIPHLGNYYGALVQWLTLARDRKINRTRSDGTSVTVQCDKPIFSIVDVHAYSSRRVQFGTPLYSNILDTTASLLAIGLTLENCILFRQSDILEHNYLANVLDNFISTQRLARMTQYKEKTGNGKGNSFIPNGLLTYPVLQAADILLYKADTVPVGEDQMQHIELTRDIARRFNESTASQLFPQPDSLLNTSIHARRVKSLRDPHKKMSKSDLDKKSFIEIVDEPDILLEKIKKAKTDCESRIFYDSLGRPGISNLMRIHHLATGQSFADIEKHYEGVESAQYKLSLAEILIDKFKSVRDEFRRIRSDPLYLEETIKEGYKQAKPIAEQTALEVKLLLGSLGTEK